MTANLNFDTYGGRRFILTMGCGVVCTLLVMCGKITDVIFRDIILGTVAAYITGNVWQKIKAPTDGSTS